MSVRAPSKKPTVSHLSVPPRRGSSVNRTRVFDAFSAAGIRINPLDAHPWDILVKDENQFVRRIASPLNDGLTALGDMYVEGVWDCEAISECFYRAFKARLNSRLIWNLPNIVQYLRSR